MFQLLSPIPSLHFEQLLILIRSIFLILLLFSAKAIFAISICSEPEMACGAQLRSYPLLKSKENSDWNGESSMRDIPLYDEFFPPVHKFDLSKTANLTGERICECPNATSCHMDDEKRIIKLDEMVTLIFCNRVDDIFRRSCHGKRSLIRVVGRIHESGEALTSVMQTFLFCKCDRGYHRIRVEAWLNHLYAFIYRCL
uniref:Uncharacterized protein n=1 Tax=Setaria digitata TaxID=48799 RepID=A0A915PU09_9BILA